MHATFKSISTDSGMVTQIQLATQSAFGRHRRLDCRNHAHSPRYVQSGQMRPHETNILLFRNGIRRVGRIGSHIWTVYIVLSKSILCVFWNFTSHFNGYDKHETTLINPNKTLSMSMMPLLCS